MKKLVLVLSGFGATTGTALAAVPPEVTTALTEAKSDALAVAALALIVVIAIAAFKYMKRAV